MILWLELEHNYLFFDDKNNKSQIIYYSSLEFVQNCLIVNEAEIFLRDV